MIKEIIHLLNEDEWIIGDKDIDFAKGEYKLPTTIKEAKKLIKRRYGKQHRNIKNTDRRR